MKTFLCLLAAASLGGCQQQMVAPVPAATTAAPLASVQGRIVAVEPTKLIASFNVSPVRWRWRVELAPPLTLPGNPNSHTTAFSEVKTFSFAVADTAAFRPGTRISFTYQVLPWSPPQWYSIPEAISAAPRPPHYDLPEVTLANVQAL
ncbi:hypothetical protein [Hymenobacter properus]|uniref:Uncharacterized protein n=1 Tax=Hymenobacter properus TaxID=2791026 RepID=A0A931FJ72_9BACT|nr:hypothetical protein [Hymenobacter properus]MBF9141568.1 hypothetical protein [Hymenobacter properus]MBR7720377.1 hypothetical protein [Microvirga sp. SRT04]